MHVYLETERLILRRFTMADLDDVVELDSDEHHANGDPCDGQSGLSSTGKSTGRSPGAGSDSSRKRAGLWLPTNHNPARLHAQHRGSPVD